MGFSVIKYYGEQKNKCGYCKGTDCCISHGMHSYALRAEDYQDLIDRGWRRCGHYCYKPNNEVTCCPCYTIRCDALEFKLTKSQKKVLRRMNRFLRDGKKDNETVNLEESGDRIEKCGLEASAGGGIRDEPQAPDMPIPAINLENVKAAYKVNVQTIELQTKTKTETIPMQGTSLLTTSEGGIQKQHPSCKKAKQIRIEKKKAKLASKGLTLNTESAGSVKSFKNQEKSITDYLIDTDTNDKHKLQLTLVQVKSIQFTKTRDSTFQLYKKYQTHIHNDPPVNIDEYLDFLQRSPLKNSQSEDETTPCFGSYHQQYWLDDILIAVAVIDILPTCISSVYFFYDPDYSFLSLGTYASLREIELVQQLAKKLPSLKYYYMGFYIHSCPKMRYKGKLSPSYLLCPETYTWILLTDEIRSNFEVNKYQRLNNDSQARDVDEFRDDHLSDVLLLIDNSYTTYRQYIQVTGDQDDRAEILEYSKLVGKTCAHRMLYVKI